MFPAAATLFADIDSAVTLSFLERFTTQDAADWLSVEAAGDLAEAASTTAAASTPGCCTPGSLAAPTRHDRTDTPTCTRAPPWPWSRVLRALNTQIAALAVSIGDQLDVHPDAEIFTSPAPLRARVRAARLLAEIGDARGRFPTRDSLACLAGVAPSTRQSGKVKSVIFRWGADKQLRDALCDFAGDSRHANPWAADLYDKARARGCDHPHAVRILARAWAHVIWRCWQDNTALQPRNPRRPPNHPQPRSTEGCLTQGLTQGNSRPVGFPGPPAAPAVRLSPQRALHMSYQLVSR